MLDREYVTGCRRRDERPGPSRLESESAFASLQLEAENQGDHIGPAQGRDWFESSHG